jgi:DNA-binding NtrC family response regulator
VSCTVLLVDDDPQILESIGSYLERTGYEVQLASTGGGGLALHESHGQDVVLLDLQLPDQSGLEVLEQLRTHDAAVILLTGHGDIETAVRAMQLGAEDFLTKPVDMQHLSALIDRTAEKVRLRREVERLKSRYEPDLSPAGLGASPKMREIARQVALIAASDRTTVLLTGESGTGKGWVARLIHGLSRRAGRPFVDINCGGLSPTFLDSELFGHEKGAFTDAKEMKRGLFEVADSGTLFLDEIGELALALQPKLLRVLEVKSFRRLGGTLERTVDVRLIAATNRDLEAAVAERVFREDLFYRISVAVVHLPPLRERTREDRLTLLQWFLASLSHDFPGASSEISADALDRLASYVWPGNIREMRNALERALIMARGGRIRLEHLTSEIRGRRRGPAGRAASGQSLEQVERLHIERTLKKHGGNRTHAAEELGVSRATLIKKIKKYDLSS